MNSISTIRRTICWMSWCAVALLPHTFCTAAAAELPTAEAVAQLNYADLTARQYSQRKAEYLIDIARLITSGQLTLDPLAPASQIEKQLMAIRGLGKWSTNYIMMRVLGFADCVPLGDTGLTTALQQFYALDHRPDVEETTELMKPFAPYRSLATYHLWTSLGGTPA